MLKNVSYDILPKIGNWSIPEQSRNVSFGMHQHQRETKQNNEIP